MDTYEKMYFGLLGTDDRSKLFYFQPFDHRKYICPCDFWTQSSTSSNEPTEINITDMIKINQYIFREEFASGPFGNNGCQIEESDIFQKNASIDDVNENGDWLLGLVVIIGYCIVVIVLIIFSLIICRQIAKKSRSGGRNKLIGGGGQDIVLNNFDESGKFSESNILRRRMENPPRPFTTVFIPASNFTNPDNDHTGNRLTTYGSMGVMGDGRRCWNEEINNAGYSCDLSNLNNSGTRMHLKESSLLVEYSQAGCLRSSAINTNQNQHTKTCRHSNQINYDTT